MTLTNLLRPGPEGKSYTPMAIIVGNAIAIALALVLDWSIFALAAPFWLQSVIIGYYAYRRILALNSFSTENYRVGGHRPAATTATKRLTAKFFAWHYGGFHAMYLIALLGLGLDQAILAAGPLDVLACISIGASFWFSQRKAHRDDLAADSTRTTNIGLPVLLPYLRVIPMHIVIGVGAFRGATDAIIVFGVLKTLAEVAAFQIEQLILRNSSKAQPTTEDPP